MLGQIALAGEKGRKGLFPVDSTYIGNPKPYIGNRNPYIGNPKPYIGNRSHM